MCYDFFSVLRLIQFLCLGSFFSFLNFENFRSFFIALKSRAVALGSVRINAQLLRNVIIKTIRDDDEFKRFIISSS